MPESTTPAPQKLPEYAAAIDHFIGANLPSWTHKAAKPVIDAWVTALKQHHGLQAKVAALLAPIQDPQTFCTPLLANALRDRLAPGVDIAGLRFKEVKLSQSRPAFSLGPERGLVSYEVETPLLQRAMQNFSEAQAGGSFFDGSSILDANGTLDIAPGQFAHVCRTLDLGAAYQKHIAAALVSDSPSVKAERLRLLADDRRVMLEVDTLRSYMKKDIDAPAYLLLQQVLKGTAALTFQRYEVEISALSVLDQPVAGAFVLAAYTGPGEGALRWGTLNAIRQVLVYLPNDPLKPLRQYPTWSAFVAELVGDLKKTAYREYFQGLVNLKERAAFQNALQTQLKKSTPDLSVRQTTQAGTLFDWLAQQLIRRIQDDAGVLVVTTASFDAEVRRQWHEALEEAGLTVLGVAASFVPGVSQVMLANTVLQTLSGVYECVEDWTHGQRSEALDHLCAIAVNLAAGAALGVGASTLVAAARRSAFVDKLVPIVRSLGDYRLWNADLAVYHHERLLPVMDYVRADGLVEADGDYWLKHEQKVYRVQEREGRWCLCHRERPQAYGPPLETNGEGSWRFPDEDPTQWQDRRMMLRRLGPLANSLSDERADQVLSIVNYDADQLRELHIERRPVPVHLQTTLEHFHTDKRLDHFFTKLEAQTTATGLDPKFYAFCVERLQPQVPDEAVNDQLERIWEQMPRLRYELFEHLNAETETPVDANVAMLQRDFRGLPRQYAEEIVARATQQEIEALVQRQRIPLAMAERARKAQAQARLINAMEGLCLRSTCSDDCVSLAFGLLRHMPKWPAGLNLELRERSVYGRVIERLLPLEETVETRILVRTQGEFEVFDADGHELDEPLAFPTGLFEAIGGSVTPSQRDALGWTRADSVDQVRQHLIKAAQARRELLPNLLGQTSSREGFNPGERLQDGRVGYPMSGRAVRRGPFTAVVRTLFPGFSDSQIEVFLMQLANSRTPVLSILMRYQDEYNSLDASLEVWRRAANGMTRRTRRGVADELRRCWRRQTPRALDETGQQRGYRLDIVGAQVSQLPALSDQISFSHVTQLTLQGLRLTELPEAFLSSFSNARMVNLGDNRLTRIPTGLTSIRNLRYLLMGRNRINLRQSGGETLVGLNQVEVLDMEHNPIEVLPNMSGFHRLRELRLRNARIQVLDTGLLRCPFLEFVDLRDNLITQLPEAYFQFFRPDNFMLNGNPIPHALWERVNARVAVPQAQFNEVHEFIPAIIPEQTRTRWVQFGDDAEQARRAAAWTLLLETPESTEFFRLLGELTRTAEFQLTRDDIDRRVWEMIDASIEHTELRDQLFSLAAGPRGCQDTVANNFSALEVHYQVFQARRQAAASSQPQTVLLAFARRLFRLDQVEQFARTDMDARRQGNRGVDEIEVSLAYRLHLARELDLPGQPTRMFYEATANVAPSQYRAAAQAVRAAEASPELARFISTRDFWVEYLRQEHPSDYLRTEQRFDSRLDMLMELWGVIPDGDMNQRLRALGDDRTAALNALALNLTIHALK